MNSRNFTLGGIAVVVIAALALGGWIFERNMAGNLQVKQAAVSGDLTCRIEPGMYPQLFGTITTYREAETFYFTADEHTGENRDESLPTRFNDGAKARVSGSLRVLMPRDCQSLLLVHRKFRGMDGVMEKLVLPAVRKALFSTGPHMSAGESYAERRGEFASLAEDQLSFGVIQTDKRQEEREDPITGEDRMVWVLLKRQCETTDGDHCINGFVRDQSAFSEFSIRITNFVIDGIDYCPDTTTTPGMPENASKCPVLEQIETQRSARMNVITQQAQAKEAEARAAKAKADAIAQIEETRATEEVAKTRRIVKAEAAKEEARLKRDAAEFTKEEQILLGEGEAERKKAVLLADGALEKKLAAYETVMGAAFEAVAQYRGNWVPTVQMGGSSGDGDSINGAQALIDMFSAKVAQDLALDMSVPKGRTRDDR